MKIFLLSLRLSQSDIKRKRNISFLHFLTENALTIFCIIFWRLISLYVVHSYIKLFMVFCIKMFLNRCEKFTLIYFIFSRCISCCSSNFEMISLQFCWRRSSKFLNVLFDDCDFFFFILLFFFFFYRSSMCLLNSYRVE